MKTLFESIENEISESLTNLQNLSTNRGQFEVLTQKNKAFGVELERLNVVIPKLSNDYNRANKLSQDEILKLKEFIDNSMSEFLKKSRTPGINTDYKFDTELL